MMENFSNFLDLKLSALPYWIRYRREGQNIVIADVLLNRFFVCRDPFSVGLRVLSLLSKGGITVKEMLKELEITSTKEAYWIIKFCRELFGKVIFKQESQVGKQTLHNLSAPLDLELIITYRCNARCRHCLVGGYRYSKQSDMPLKVIKKIAREVHEFNVFTIALTGGEPTVREDFFEVLDILKSAQAITLVTNGLLLTREFVKRLDKYPIRWYALSLEGASAQTHDFIRGRGSFIKVLMAIENIKSLSAAPVSVKVACGKHNYHELEKIVKLCIDLGVAMVEFARLSPWGWGKALAELCFSGEEILQFNRTIIELREEYKDKISIYGVVSGGCGILSSLAIQPNGNVLPCRIFELAPTNEVVILGNIKETGLGEIWNSLKARRIREYAANLESMSVNCRRCKYYDACLYPHCLARAFLASPGSSPLEAARLLRCPGPR